MPRRITAKTPTTTARGPSTGPALDPADAVTRAVVRASLGALDAAAALALLAMLRGWLLELLGARAVDGRAPDEVTRAATDAMLEVMPRHAEAVACACVAALWSVGLYELAEQVAAGNTSSADLRAGLEELELARVDLESRVHRVVLPMGALRVEVNGHTLYPADGPALPTSAPRRDPREATLRGLVRSLSAADARNALVNLLLANGGAL